MDGFLLIHKPIGMTSHDVVLKIRKKFHEQKIGHTGTLDPFASGLLILCLGKATKLAYLFSDLDKSYDGTIVFGKHYDTYDVTGKVEKEDDVFLIEAEIKDAMQTFVGEYNQIPPMYSALKVDGKKLYDIARAGETVDRESRLVRIDQFEMTSPFVHDECQFITHVSKGTYIRSLAVDLATKLKTYGALKQLNRRSIGPYTLENAKKIEEVSVSDLISLESFFEHTHSIQLNDYMIKLVKNGIYLDDRQIKTDKPFIVKDQHGNMVAYYTLIDEHQYRPVLIF